MIARDFDLNKSALVRIYQLNSTFTSGMGLLFSKKYVLTCAHVVNSCAKVVDSQYFVELDFPYISNNGKKIKAKLNSSYLSEDSSDNPEKGSADIAILELQSEHDLPSEAKPLQLTLSENDSEPGNRVKIIGYPEELNRPIWATGTIAGASEDWVQINGIPNQPQVKPGYSGSPVWNENSRKFVGITIARVDPDLEDSQATTRTSFMIPNVILKQYIGEEYELFKKLPSPTPSPILGYQDIISQLKGGLVIPFIGPGINRSLYRQLESALTDKVGQLILKDKWNDLDKNEGKRELIKQLIGIPWPECPYLISERPENPKHSEYLCPVIQELNRNNQELQSEQDLSVIKRNIRYFSLYCKLYLGDCDDNNDREISVFYRILDEIFEQSHLFNNEPISEFYKFLAKPPDSITSRVPDIPFKLIITTNFDNQLTGVFDYYNLPYDLVFYVAAGSEKGKFKHLKHQPPQSDTINIIGPDYDSFEQLGKQPLILQLYGRWDKQLSSNDTNSFKNNFFVIDELQFHELLNNLQNLPEKLLEILKDSHLLFVGYTSNDYELQMIMHQLHQKDFKFKSSWLINHSQSREPSQLANKIWGKFNTEIKATSQTIADFSQMLRTKIT